MMSAGLFSSVKPRPLSQQGGGAAWPAEQEALQEFPAPGVVLQPLAVTASPRADGSWAWMMCDGYSLITVGILS